MYSNQDVQETIHRVLQTLIATALTSHLPCGSNIFRFFRCEEQHPAGTHDTSISVHACKEAGTDMQQPTAPATASTPHIVWAGLFLSGTSTPCTIHLQELLQLHAEANRCMPRVEAAAPKDTQTTTSIVYADSELISFAAMALGHPLHELLGFHRNTPGVAPWSILLSAASGESCTLLTSWHLPVLELPPC